ncbi:Bbp19 family protein [Aestuariispira ectoiniformans]|uniref:Bbp19 family protein n=1 Tax=Aestuariispira ectoiniformans TaxID=2775080 RepID=UPI00223A9D5F|nr:hypothetical protein [Aestuariispira ectoiniformans]
MARPDSTSDDWLWRGVETTAHDEDAVSLARDFVRTFESDRGQRVLNYLRRQTVERALGADANDAALRLIEGQRLLVLKIESLIARGRSL